MGKVLNLVWNTVGAAPRIVTYRGGDWENYCLRRRHSEEIPETTGDVPLGVETSGPLVGWSAWMSHLKKRASAITA